MWEWLKGHVRGEHEKKMSEIEEYDDYMRYVYEDFNRRLQFGVFVGFVMGVLAGVVLMIVATQ